MKLRCKLFGTFSTKKAIQMLKLSFTIAFHIYKFYQRYRETISFIITISKMRNLKIRTLF